MRDYSLEGKTISLYGDPLLMDGTPFNDGSKWGGVKSTCLRFNRPTSDFVNTEYIKINSSARVRAMENLSSGISFFIRFRIHDLATQAGWNRTLYQKRDDSTTLPNNGIRVLIDADGRVIVRIRKTDGTQYNKQTATSTIAVNTVYDLWVTYAVSGNVVHIYINNSDMSLTDPGVSSDWGLPATDLDWYLFKRGGSSEEKGYVYGDLYDFRIYREKVVSSTEVGYFNTNKWTIADVPYGQVMIANYFSSAP